MSVNAKKTGGKRRKNTILTRSATFFLDVDFYPGDVAQLLVTGLTRVVVANLVLTVVPADIGLF